MKMNAGGDGKALAVNAIGNGDRFDRFRLESMEKASNGQRCCIAVGTEHPCTVVDERGLDNDKVLMSVDEIAHPDFCTHERSLPKT